MCSSDLTLAAQLHGEFKEYFPDNAVEFFVSYYDYYQPEAYVASADTYIEKDSQINDEIDKLRHSATAALAERNDVIVEPDRLYPAEWCKRPDRSTDQPAGYRAGWGWF